MFFQGGLEGVPAAAHLSIQSASSNARADVASVRLALLLPLAGKLLQELQGSPEDQRAFSPQE